MFEFPLAYVDQPVIRHARGAGALRQLKLLITLLFNVVQGFQRRGGRAQYHGQVQLAGTPHGEITRRVTEAILLLERGIMLLIDDQQARACQRCENG